MGRLLQSRQKEKLAAELAEKFGVEIDTRTRSEVIADLRRRGIEAVPSAIRIIQLDFNSQERSGSAETKAKDQIFALSGISNKVTILCNESGQHIMYDSDEHGFNNANGLWGSGPVDVVALGDSFTQGTAFLPTRILWLLFTVIILRRLPASATTLRPFNVCRKR
jgi:hypothetical protein